MGQGLGKRDADADAYGYGYGYAPLRALGGAGVHPTGISFSNRSPQGHGKRDADADAYGYGYAPVLAKGYPSWPGVVAPGFESTCYGCGLDKREAVEEPKNALATHPNGGTSFVGETVWGFPLAKAVEKREAEPFY